jgi:hypothetical protein
LWLCSSGVMAPQMILFIRMLRFLFACLQVAAC